MMNKYNFISRILCGFEEDCNTIRIYKDGIIMEGVSNVCYPDMGVVYRRDVSLARRACSKKIRQIAKIPYEMRVIFYDSAKEDDPACFEEVVIPRHNIIYALEVIYKLCTQSYAKAWEEAGAGF